MHLHEFKEITETDAHTTTGGDGLAIVHKLDKVEQDIFQGGTEIAPVKWYQIDRIFRLAKTFLELLVVIGPYVKAIIALIKTGVLKPKV